MSSVDLAILYPAFLTGLLVLATHVPLGQLVLERGSRAGSSALRITEFKIRDAQQNVSAGKPAEVAVTAP